MELRSRQLKRVIVASDLFCFFLKSHLGWMQLVILIYHVTGASQVVPLYMQMRILVSSYLFLTGFGHLSFFWNGGTASFVRLCQVCRFTTILN